MSEGFYVPGFPPDHVSDAVAEWDGDQFVVVCNRQEGRHTLSDHFARMHDVPYHRHDGTTGEWLGLTRALPPARIEGS